MYYLYYFIKLYYSEAHILHRKRHRPIPVLSNAVLLASRVPLASLIIFNFMTLKNALRTLKNALRTLKNGLKRLRTVKTKRRKRNGDGNNHLKLKAILKTFKRCHRFMNGYDEWSKMKNLLYTGSKK